MQVSAEWYQQQIDKHKLALARVKKALFTTAVARLLVFMVFCWSIYRLFFLRDIFTVLFTLISLCIFLWLVRHSSRLSAKKTFVQNLLFINENEAGIWRGAKNEFDCGRAFNNGQSYYEDLDVFGDGSLYQLLNRATTLYGAEAIARYLQTPLLQGEAIIAQQAAVQQLAPQFQQRQHITAAAMGQEKMTESYHSLYAWLATPPFVRTNPLLNGVRWLLPVINIATLLLSLYTEQYAAISLTVLLSWLFVGYAAKYTNQQAALVGRKQEALQTNAAVLLQFNGVDTGASSVLSHLQQHTANAYYALNRLAALVNLADQRLNLLVNIFLNSFLLYDLHAMAALEKWKVANSNQLQKWLYAVGEIERLVSFSTYVFNHPDNCFPSLASDTPQITARQMYHPLIPVEVNVANDIAIGTPAKLMLITGSNMSGKTTYLRTTGVNLLMAQIGLPVCASSFVFSPMRIYTSIRISDSLQEQTSYFMAELKRLQFIKQQVENGTPALVLIDEILRGTNSTDKYYGSQQFVLQLIRYNCISLFATHDLKLSEMEQQHEGLIENYCFESTIVDNELLFDYTMLRGVARNKNASFLMQKMNII